MHTNPNFPKFVTKVLNDVTQNLPRISKLSIHTHSTTKDSDITSWIEKAVLHSVQVLHVSRGFNFDWVKNQTPHCLFTSKNLVSLTLDLLFRLSIPDKVCLPKLKKLCLRNMVLSNEADDAVKRLFSSCSVLEKLSVHYWTLENAKVFDVSIPSLEVLNMCWSDSESKLLINCPNLEVFTYEGYPMRGGYSGDVLESLKECNLDIKVDIHQTIEDVTDLVKQVCKTRLLSLAGDMMEGLLHPRYSLPTFGNLTHLKLESDFGWKSLPNILESSPRLETLTFPMGLIMDSGYEGVQFSPPKHVPACLTNHLTVIRFDNFLGEEDEYKLVEYFLTNALVLERMEICLWSSEDSEEEEEEGSMKCHFEITKQLLTFQRFSKVCQILIVEPVE